MRVRVARLLTRVAVLKRCVPNPPVSTNANLTTAAALVKAQVISYLNARGLSLEIGRDIFNEWRIIAISFGIAVGCALVWLVLLQIFTGFMVWTSIFAVLIASLGSTAYFWYNWYAITNDLDFLGRQFDFSGLNTYVYNSSTFLACAIITSVIAALLLLSLMFLGSRIRLAIAIVKVASRAVLKMPSLLLFPLFKAVLLLGVCAFFLFVMIYLSTAGEINTISLDYIDPRLSQASFTSNSYAARSPNFPPRPPFSSAAHTPPPARRQSVQLFADLRPVWLFLGVEPRDRDR